MTKREKKEIERGKSIFLVDLWQNHSTKPTVNHFSARFAAKSIRFCIFMRKCSLYLLSKNENMKTDALHSLDGLPKDRRKIPPPSKDDA